MFFKKTQSFIGVDIGTKFLKLTILEKTKGFYVVKAFEKYEIEDYVDGYKITNAEELKKIFKTFIQTHNALNYKVLVSIPNDSSNSLMTRIFSTMKLNKYELDNAIKIEAEDRIPLEKSEYEYTWDIIDETEEEYKIMLVTMSKKMFEDYSLLFKELKLDYVFQTKTVSILNLLQNTNKTTLTVDIGHTHTEFIVSKGPNILLVRSAKYGGKIMTELLSRFLDISYEEAERKKIEKGCILTNEELANEQEEIEISNILLPQCDFILSEIKKTIMIARNEEGEEVEELLLTGGTSRLIYLREYLAKETGLTTNRFIPYFLEENENSLLQEEMDFFITALGGSFHEHTYRIYSLFFHETKEKRKDIKILDYLWIINLSFIVIASVVLHLFISTFVGNLEKERELQNQSLQKIVEENNQLLNQINSISGELSMIESERNSLMQLQSEINNIRSNKVSYFDSLINIRRTIPDTLQLDEISIQNNTVTLLGVSPTFSDLGIFIKELEYGGDFSNISFTYEEQNNKGEEFVLKVITFVVTMDIIH